MRVPRPRARAPSSGAGLERARDVVPAATRRGRGVGPCGPARPGGGLARGRRGGRCRAHGLPAGRGGGGGERRRYEGRRDGGGRTPLRAPLDRSVFDGTRGRYREDDLPAPVGSYGRSKLEAERVVGELQPAATIVRTSLIYGGAQPGPQERLAQEGTRFFVDEIRSPVQVTDLADALLELLRIDAPGPLHLGGADDVSRFDFAVLLGADRAAIEGARTTPERAPDVSLDSSRAAELLQTRLRGAYEVLGSGSNGAPRATSSR